MKGLMDCLLDIKQTVLGPHERPINKNDLNNLSIYPPDIASRRPRIIQDIKVFPPIRLHRAEESSAGADGGRLNRIISGSGFGIIR